MFDLMPFKEQLELYQESSPNTVLQ